MRAIGSHRSNQSAPFAGGERGNALIEFMISLPFLIGILTGIIDITLALKEYYFLADAVSAGAQRAMTAPNLVFGLDYASGTRANCVGQTDPNHDLIHERVEEMVTLHNRQLTQICVLSHREPPGATPEQNTVLVQAIASYDGFFLPFKGLTISAQARVPYLLN